MFSGCFYSLPVVLDSIWPTTVTGWIELIGVIASAVALLAIVVPLCIAIIKKSIEVVKKDGLSKLTEYIGDAVTKAEKSGESGSTKLSMALSFLESMAGSLGITYNSALATALTEKINDYIATHNSLETIESVNKSTATTKVVTTNATASTGNSVGMVSDAATNATTVVTTDHK